MKMLKWDIMVGMLNSNMNQMNMMMIAIPIVQLQVNHKRMG